MSAGSTSVMSHSSCLPKHLTARLPAQLIADLPGGRCIVCGTVQPRRWHSRHAAPPPRCHGSGAAVRCALPVRQWSAGVQPLRCSGCQLWSAPAHLSAPARGEQSAMPRYAAALQAPGAAALPAADVLCGAAPSCAVLYSWHILPQLCVLAVLLQVEGSGPPISVCTGAEWHRFPSAFFLPGQRYRLQVGCAGINALLCASGGMHSYEARQRSVSRWRPSFWRQLACCTGARHCIANCDPSRRCYWLLPCSLSSQVLMACCPTSSMTSRQVCGSHRVPQ